MTSTPTHELIDKLHLVKHPEGGYYVETDRQEGKVPSPFADNAPRSLSTSIYYLLTADSSEGVIHMNKSVTYHVLHQGRAEYTLITPRPGAPPKIETAIMGTDADKGETRLLLVGSGVWKMSRLLPEDVEDKEKARVGCLITEVVVPGFHWEDHKFLTMDGLMGLCKGFDIDKELMSRLARSVRRA
ncbi:RmlC-like cupin domain-containing protein [Desarmillaria tabescens]|uniref:RmlC-like cupin domain-containing protein n=1 Tax=Armillaria tabescens TaxID=1929756 RepID=A0AA39TTZ3_ARMTA|nr:RmlC-like cupin domain-containing protein [Desarmillaria tabescens]KAK0466363.1 RmlC-like cupin domain-containing protein [Desarmillaria tabescens]